MEDNKVVTDVKIETKAAWSACGRRSRRHSSNLNKESPEEALVEQLAQEQSK